MKPPDALEHLISEQSHAFAAANRDQRKPQPGHTGQGNEEKDGEGDQADRPHADREDCLSSAERSPSHGQLQRGFPFQVVGEVEFDRQPPHPTPPREDLVLVVRVVRDERIHLVGDRRDRQHDEGAEDGRESERDYRRRRAARQPMLVKEPDDGVQPDGDE
jgi:hypothetical protein